MTLQFRFAVISDPHIALPETIWDHPNRFHLVEVSIPAIESIFAHLNQLDLDFLLLPGDLTQHGEPENHTWLAQRLAQLPYPAYVIPGNHDVVTREASDRSIGLMDFPQYYQKFGYQDGVDPYYTCSILPGLRLIGLNSNGFDAEGNQLRSGYLDSRQLAWLQQILADASEETILVMLHHNVLEHLPGQQQSPLGSRYMLQNNAELLAILRQAGVELLFTGHLHVQDVAYTHGLHEITRLYEITTGSLVSYPHPYRILELHQDRQGHRWLRMESHWIQQVPGWNNLQHYSRQWMGDRSISFIVKLLTQSPLALLPEEALEIAPDLRDFWADIAYGDQQFHFPHLPQRVQRFLSGFSAVDAQGAPQTIDNAAVLSLTAKLV
ncbi:MAG: metallophosphoesterase [Elainella sp. Prado103]|jgi:UDP-2,3-diacylglucosamine pyrophosphatase LpxH|nr:metallophosphoesterase [Elainella sp. Prado103]